MKKLCVCGAALSLMLLACGDDSSSGADSLTGGEEIESSGSVVGSSGAQATASSAEIATSSAEAGESSSGGSTPESSETGTSSSAGSPESSATTPESSATTPESSSTGSSSSVAANSSSGAQPSDRPVQMAAVVGGKCMEDNSSGDVMLDGGAGADQALPPVAYMTLKDGSDMAQVVVERVMMPCSQISGVAGMVKQVPLDSVEITAAGDTLYVKPKMAEGTDKCVCHAQIYFTMKAETAFMQTTLLVMDDKLNMGNRMRIVMDDYESEESKQLKSAGYYKGECMKETAAPVTAAKELPFATMHYNPGGQSVVELNNVEDYCEIEAKISQKVNGDTLFVDYYDMGAVTKCICNFDAIKFAIDPQNTDVEYFSFKSVLYRLQGPEVVD